MSTLVLNTQREELLNEIVKYSHLSTSEVSILLNLTTNQVRGLRRSATLRERKNVKDAIAFKKNEKKINIKSYDKKIKDAIENGVKTLLDDGDFNNVNGENKKQTRVIIHDAFQPNDKPSLSLPFECDLERLILSKYPNQKFIGFEKYKNVFDKGLKIIENNYLPIDLILGNINDYIKSSKTETFGNLLLDYCGSFLTNAETIRYAVENDLVVRGGIIAITSLRANRGKKTEQKQKYYYDTINNNGGDNRCQSDKDNETYLHKLCGINNKYSLEQVFYYKDRSSMVLYILRRNF